MALVKQSILSGWLPRRPPEHQNVAVVIEARISHTTSLNFLNTTRMEIPALSNADVE
jgi:hypothetical protein